MGDLILSEKQKELLFGDSDDPIAERGAITEALKRWNNFPIPYNWSEEIGIFLHAIHSENG